MLILLGNSCKSWICGFTAFQNCGRLCLKHSHPLLEPHVRVRLSGIIPARRGSCFPVLFFSVNHHGQSLYYSSSAIFASAVSSLLLISSSDLQKSWEHRTELSRGPHAAVSSVNTVVTSEKSICRFPLLPRSTAFLCQLP